MEVPDKLLLEAPQAAASYSHLLGLTAHLHASSHPEALDARSGQLGALHRTLTCAAC